MFKLIGRDADGRIVAEETTLASTTADKVAAGWRDSGLTVEVEERASQVDEA